MVTTNSSYKHEDTVNSERNDASVNPRRTANGSSRIADAVDEAPEPHHLSSSFVGSKQPTAVRILVLASNDAGVAPFERYNNVRLQLCEENVLIFVSSDKSTIDIFLMVTHADAIFCLDLKFPFYMPTNIVSHQLLALINFPNVTR